MGAVQGKFRGFFIESVNYETELFITLSFDIFLITPTNHEAFVFLQPPKMIKAMFGEVISNGGKQAFTTDGKVLY